MQLTLQMANQPELLGQPWLCRPHDRAGCAQERPCCNHATVVGRHSDAVAWSILRLAAKPTSTRLEIQATIDDPAACLSTLSRHAVASERAWLWIAASQRSRKQPPTRPRK